MRNMYNRAKNLSTLYAGIGDEKKSLKTISDLRNVPGCLVGWMDEKFAAKMQP